MPNPTNYAKTAPNASNYNGIIKNKFFLLLQDGVSFLLLQDGVSKLIFESSITNKANYSKTNPNPTNYVTI